MPRPVDPKFGQDGYEEGAASFSVEREDLSGVLAALGQAGDADLAANLRACLIDVGSRYWRWNGRGADAFSRAEARKGLQLLLAESPIDSAAISGLNERAQQLVHDHLALIDPSLLPSGLTAAEALFRDQIPERHIRDAVMSAVEALTHQKGQDINHGLRICVGELCQIYQELTGKSVTLSNKDGRLYTREPGSEAGRFVHACVGLIDPEVPDHRLNGVIRLWIAGGTRA
jgi:hypothetical protein